MSKEISVAQGKMKLTPIAVFLSQIRLSATGTTVEATNTPVNS